MNRRTTIHGDRCHRITRQWKFAAVCLTFGTRRWLPARFTTTICSRTSHRHIVTLPSAVTVTVAKYDHTTTEFTYIHNKTIKSSLSPQFISTLCPQKNHNPRQCKIEMSKSERILTKLRVLDYEYICDRIAKFHKKILCITRVINIQILMTKYFSFQYSVTYCSQTLRRPAHRARETVHLLTHETPNFITPALWQPTVLALTQSTTRFGGSCRSVCTTARFVTSTS